ncbi:hypothetical protein LCGC14_1296020 [marine sediment metagenome]|uniref:Transglycosylase SLT domain-containing protein n=1 Tax=marine sediment metagenome TaxID=412755 RepID=A0A0F9KSV6_9ZZZZ|nr:lytic transglycosylase domain-containing protein [bacterium]
MYVTRDKTALKRDYRGLRAIPSVQQTSVIAISPVFYRDPQVLAVLDEIIRRESNGNLLAKNPKSTASGLTQLISSTVELCEVNLNKEIDPFNSSDNLECALWLLEQPNGIKHWDASGPYSYD